MNDVNEPSKSDKPKIREKNFFCLRLEGHRRKEQDREPDPDPLVRGPEPDPYQNVTDPEHCVSIVVVVSMMLCAGLMMSLHMKATMMKISDPIIFGHCVKVYFKASSTYYLLLVCSSRLARQIPKLCQFQPVLRIRDVYPGSRILIFTHPGSRIPDSKTARKRRVKKNLLLFFVSTNFTKMNIIWFMKC
jgi:hypothetical protein